MLRACLSATLIASFLCACRPPAPATERPAEDASNPALPARFVVMYGFDQNKLSAEAESTLRAALLAQKRRPGSTLLIVGHASDDERDATTLASHRARMAAGFMIVRDGAEPKTMLVDVKTSPDDSPMIELIVDAVAKARAPIKRTDK
jgi:outer membrane protein OmpA-like peptidoglycan-associated protein